jgi:hypothetical protein
MTGIRSATKTKEKRTTESNQTYFDSKVVSRYISPEKNVMKRNRMGKVELTSGPRKKMYEEEISQSDFYIQRGYEKRKIGDGPDVNALV